MNQKKIKKLRQEAKKRFMKGVSLAGLFEIYHAPNTVIRLMYTLAIFLSIGSIFYHSMLLIDLYLNQPKAFEIFQTDTKIVPLPRVTVCAPSGLNQSWALDHLRFPAREQKMFDRFDQKQKDEFIEAVISLMGGGSEYIIEKKLKPNSPHYFAYNHVIAESFKYFPNGQPAVTQPGGMQSCENTISNCRLNGIFYDCCKDNILMIADDGPRFDLQVSKIDKQLNYPRLPMSATELKFDLRMNWNYITPYYTINGFFVHVGEPYALTGKPIAVPGGTHAMIDVSQPTWRSDRSRCFSEKQPDTIFGEYDEVGFGCLGQRYMLEVTQKYLGCMYAASTLRPNSSNVCPGSTTLPYKSIMANGIDTPKLESGQHSTLYDIMNSETKCLPYCQKWDYKPRPSFSELMRDDYATPIGRNSSDNVTSSRVTVYMGSPFYMERTEQAPKPFYTFFVQITFVVQLYLGFSVVTLAEIIFHGWSLGLVYMKTGYKMGKVSPEK